MSDLPVSHLLHHAGNWSGEATPCSLTYEARFFRRRKLTTDPGWALVADFAQTVSLADGDALECEDGRLVRIVAAPERLIAVGGPDIARYAWHIGNRHTPCQVAPGRLLIQDDRVIAHMLAHLGAELSPVTAPFTPEGGAYGHGRTHAHEHGQSAHAH